ncbi:unnamed protein product [Periconia digitata]|uniref:Plasma membrane fusion protein PRM1 n=1 Tax=Periconia digitata TaxID=1303443 RepID=A0A9W4XK32_9PLEO|nr:unnamed protein product [Periconia digitata]
MFGETPCSSSGPAPTRDHAFTNYSVAGMASTANQQQPFPAVPPSLSAGDHEMRDYYAPQDAPRPPLTQTPYLKPYLGLRARLSQIWLNRWTILLLLVLVRLLIAIASTNSNLTSARREALSACTSVEKMGSSMASMPHFMAKGVNQMTSSGIENAVGGLFKMLDLTVKGVEELVLFVIHMMTQTYLCLITLVVTGSMHAAVEIGEAFAKGLNETVEEVTNGIGDALGKAQKTMQDIQNSIKNVPLFGNKIPDAVPNLDEQISKLKSLEAPPGIMDGVNKLNSSIPSFEEVQNFTDNIIRLPFEEIRKLIKNMDNFTFDGNALPVPQKEQLQFCSEGNSINSFFDKLIKLVYTAKKVALAVLIILALLAIVPMAWMEIRRYRRMQERAELFHQGHEPMDVIYLASRTTSGSLGLWLGHRFGSTRRQAIMRWAWAYATSMPMLFLIALGIAGLFSCFCQYLLLIKIEEKTPELTDEVADFAGQVVVKLNNASMSWSNGVNDAVGKLDKEINDDIFGWVQKGTSAVNETINVFVDKTNDLLDEAFGDTILRDPIQEVLKCLIGLKIASIQSGLTWVHDNAHVAFPGVANDTLSLGALANVDDSGSSQELLADPSGKAKDEITEAVMRVINVLKDGIRTEALIATTLIVIWLVVALTGLVYACTHMARRDTPQGTAYVVDPATDNPSKPIPSDAAPPSYEPSALAPQTRAFRTYAPNDNDSPAEKHGYVGAHTVTDSSRPGHARVSSHGHLADPSPLEDKRDPFTQASNNEKNPFNDPYRR